MPDFDDGPTPERQELDEVLESAAKAVGIPGLKWGEENPDVRHAAAVRQLIGRVAELERRLSEAAAKLEQVYRFGSSKYLDTLGDLRAILAPDAGKGTT